MKAGKLALVVTAQRFDAAMPNAFGTPGGAWQHVATMRAELVEWTDAGEESAVTLRVRNKVELRAGDRLAFRARWWAIEAVAPVGEHGDGLELRCKIRKGEAA